MSWGVLTSALQLSGCGTWCCSSPTTRCHQNVSAGKDVAPKLQHQTGEACGHTLNGKPLSRIEADRQLLDTHCCRLRMS